MYKIVDNLHETEIASVADMLPWGMIAEDGIIMTKSGGFMASWEVSGPDGSSTSDEELDHLSERVNEAMKRRETNWAFFINLYRVPSTGYPTNGAFPDRTSRLIDEERRVAYEAEGSHLESRFVLTLVLTPGSMTKSKINNFFLRGSGINEENSPGLRNLNMFKSGSDEMIRSLTGYLSFRRLKTRSVLNEFGQSYKIDEFLQFLYFTFSGKHQTIRPPASGLHIDAMLAGVGLRGDFEPKVGDTHIVVVGVTNLPEATYPGLLRQLHSLPIPFNSSIRAIMLDKAQADKEITQYERNWAMKTSSFVAALREKMGAGGDMPKANKFAMSMEADAADAKDKLEKGDLRFLFFTFSIVLFGTDRDEAIAHANVITKYLQDLGFVAEIEKETATRAYVGALPGEMFSNVTNPPVSTRNLAHMMPLTGVWPGIDSHRCPMYPKGSPALFFGKTTGNCPFRFSTHVDSVGHTMIIGPSGAGKSVFLAFSVAQFLRYPKAQGIIIDKGRSMFTLAKALELDGVARHFDIGEESDVSFCPLAYIAESNSEMEYGVAFIETLVVLADDVKLTVEKRKYIQEGLALLASDPDKSLENLIPKIADNEIQEIMSVFLKTTVGQMLNGDADTMGDSRLVFFETEGLNNTKDSLKIPLFQHIVHLAERKATRDPFLFVFDEAWALFEDDYMQRVIKSLLKLTRKKNIACIFGTQSMEDITENKMLASVLLQECLTKVFLPNPSANNETAALSYKKAGLTPHEIALLTNLKRQRDYYYVSPLGRRVFSLDLFPVALSFVAVDSGDAILHVRELMAQHPRDWPYHLLVEKGLSDWADLWKRIPIISKTEAA